MKLQDIVFFIILAVLLWKRNSNRLTIAGLLSLLISIPLFATWKFFTAVRLIWYAGAFFSTIVIVEIWKLKRVKR